MSIHLLQTDISSSPSFAGINVLLEVAEKHWLIPPKKMPFVFVNR